MNEIYKVVIEMFEELTGFNYNDVKDIPISDLKIESYIFISFVVQIENRINITIPDELLVIDGLPDIDTFAKMIENIYKTNLL